MSSTYQPNPITRRLDKLTEEWDLYKSHSSASLCHWHVQPDEYSMIEAFYERENSDAGITRDIFLRFDLNFEDKAQYHQGLMQQFEEMIAADGPLLEEEGIEMNWRGLRRNDNQVGLADLLQAFAEQNEFQEEIMVAYLAPNEISSIDDWVSWIMVATETVLPNVRWMVVDVDKAPVFEAISSYYPQQIHTIEPDLQMDDAIKEIANMGNPALAGTQYRKAFVALTQAASKQDWPQIEKNAQEALDIVKKEEWPHLQTTIYITVAGANLSAEKYEDAIMSYRQAEAVSANAYKNGDELCGKLLVQALFGVGSVYLHTRNFELAAKAYGQSTETAELIKDPYYTMEAWRMTGYAHEQDGDQEEAWKANLQALEVAKTFEKDEVANTTLPYVGVALMKIGEKLGKREVQEIHLELVEMLGEDWESMALKQIKA